MSFPKRTCLLNNVLPISPSFFRNPNQPFEQLKWPHKCCCCSVVGCACPHRFRRTGTWNGVFLQRCGEEIHDQISICQLGCKSPGEKNENDNFVIEYLTPNKIFFLSQSREIESESLLFYRELGSKVYQIKFRLKKNCSNIKLILLL